MKVVSFFPLSISLNSYSVVLIEFLNSLGFSLNLWGNAT